MYVSDQFVDGKLQLTDYRDPSTIGVLLLQDENDNKKDWKSHKLHKKRQNLVAPLANDPRMKGSIKNVFKTE